jgi:hypothetical protein
MTKEPELLDRLMALIHPREHTLERLAPDQPWTITAGVLRDVLAALTSRPPPPGLDVEQAEIAAHRSQYDQDLRDAVQWVLNDAVYKAPETLDVPSKRWLDKLSRAFFAPRPPQPAADAAPACEHEWETTPSGHRDVCIRPNCFAIRNHIRTKATR